MSGISVTIRSVHSGRVLDEAWLTVKVPSEPPETYKMLRTERLISGTTAAECVGWHIVASCPGWYAKDDEPIILTEELIEAGELTLELQVNCGLKLHVVDVSVMEDHETLPVEIYLNPSDPNDTPVVGTNGTVMQLPVDDSPEGPQVRFKVLPLPNGGEDNQFEVLGVVVQVVNYGWLSHVARPDRDGPDRDLVRLSREFWPLDAHGCKDPVELTLNVKIPGIDEPDYGDEDEEEAEGDYED